MNSRGAIAFDVAVALNRLCSNPIPTDGYTVEELIGAVAADDREFALALCFIILRDQFKDGDVSLIVSELGLDQFLGEAINEVLHGS
ncbi:MAG: hypothetical protein ACYCWN_07665 [Ferrimicrobium sp.]